MREDSPTDCVAFERQGQTSELFRSSKTTYKKTYTVLRLHFNLKFPHSSPFRVRFPRIRFDLPPPSMLTLRDATHAMDTLTRVSVSACKLPVCERNRTQSMPLGTVAQLIGRAKSFSRGEMRGVKTAVLSVLALAPSRVIVAVRGEL